MKNNHIYREFNTKNYKYSSSEVRFTKVLTKYSTEFNNYQFLFGLTQKLVMDKKDVIGLFNRVKKSVISSQLMDNMIEDLEIAYLDISRMYRILDKFNGIENDESDE